MNIPKLSFIQWATILKNLVPHVATLVRLAGVAVVPLVRTLLDFAGIVESAFPSDQPRQFSAEKRQLFIDMVVSCFVTAEASVQQVSDMAARIGPLADIIAELLTSFGIFGVKPAK